MKFSNAELASSVHHIVAQSILPQLGSPEAQAAAAAVMVAMEELAKRDARTPALLRALMPEGRAIAADLLAQVAAARLEASAALSSTLDEVDRCDDSFEGDIRRYKLLQDLLERGCKALMDAAVPGSGPIVDRAGRWELAYVNEQATPLVWNRPEASASAALTAESLQAFLRAERPDETSLTVSDFQRVPGGMSKLTYFFTLTDSTGRHERVVRKASNAQLLDLGCLNIRREYELLKRVHATGFPCPQPLWFADNPEGVDGSYYVMSKSSGKLLGNFFGAQEKLPEGLLLHLAEVFARLHSIPLSRFADGIESFSEPRYVGATVEQALRYNLEAFVRFWEELDRLPSPFEVRALRWLKQNVPQNGHPAVVTHNDLLIHNFLADGERITSVLDWEGACIGDPASDLGYVKAEVSRHMDWNRFLDHYRAHGGRPIDERSFAYHDTLTNLRNLVGTNKHTKTLQTGRGDPKDILLAYSYVPVFMAVIEKHIGAST